MPRWLAIALILAGPARLEAQTVSSAPRAAVDVVGGYAGFIDEGLIDHGVVSATLRYHLTPRISVGPELAYMVGPGDDRDLFVTGNVVFDFLARPAGSRPPAVIPYVLVGGGLMRNSNRFGSRPFSAVEGAWTAGGGVRIRLSDRVYALGEYRVGWEPHVRLTGGVGLQW
jgi:hypothetical protein